MFQYIHDNVKSCKKKWRKLYYGKKPKKEKAVKPEAAPEQKKETLNKSVDKTRIVDENSASMVLNQTAEVNEPQSD